MIHLLLMILGLGGAITLRLTAQWQTPCQDCRWQKSLRAFVMPPLLLLSTATALGIMGTGGHMGAGLIGLVSYALAIAFVIAAFTILAFQALRSLVTLHQVTAQPAIDVLNHSAHLLESDLPFIAQVGLWQPKLVMTQRLLETLDRDHLDAVLLHEAAHRHFHDTFWFFLLSCLRRLTAWLPESHTLWQELLSLRELRADRWAAQQVDPLLLAEALYQVVSAPLDAELYAGFSLAADAHNRLETRITALLEPKPPMTANFLSWRYLALVLLPLLVIPFHV